MSGAAGVGGAGHAHEMEVEVSADRIGEVVASCAAIRRGGPIGFGRRGFC